jgi:sugar O-acyltransferase (sialic acid O-acetyltransferase NeuD family)
VYCIYGAGGHAKDLIGQLSLDPSTEVLALVDDFAPGREISGIPVVTLDAAASCYPDAQWLVAIGASAHRKRVSELLSEHGLKQGNFISPRAFVARDVAISEGVQIFAGCCISSHVRIESGVIINFNCTVSHDTLIESYATISPGCSIAGRVVIKSGAFVGVGATITNGTPESPITIGRHATIGAGAVVIRDVNDEDVAVGVPAKPLNRI